MTPWPSTVCMKSWMLSMGSPKNLSPPCCSICNSPRWMAPTLAELMLPYSVVKSLALSPTYCSMARRSFRSSSSRPLSSAILNTRFSTPSWVSLRLSMRPSSSGPMSEMVARTGWPCSPNTSHSVVGQAWGVGKSSPRSLSTPASLSPILPGWLAPVRSPLMSAMNTGTPMREKFSARVCRVTVLPVPVAPVMRPWRLARPGNRWHSVAACLAISMGSAIWGFLGVRESLHALRCVCICGLGWSAALQMLAIAVAIAVLCAWQSLPIRSAPFPRDACRDFLCSAKSKISGLD